MPSVLLETRLGSPMGMHAVDAAHKQRIHVLHEQMSTSTAKLPLEEFEDVRQQMEDFSIRFHSLMLDRRSAVQTASLQHTNKVDELEHKLRRLRAEIHACRERRDVKAAEIDDSIVALGVKQDKVDGLAKQLQGLGETKTRLQGELQELKNDVSAAELALVHARSNLDFQAQRDIEELTKFEMYLGLKVEAVEEDLLRFKFVNVDTTDIDTEVSCELFVGRDTYKIMLTSVSVDPSEISAMEKSLNAHGHIVVFLKQMRKALKDAVS